MKWHKCAEVRYFSSINSWKKNSLKIFFHKHVELKESYVIKFSWEENKRIFLPLTTLFQKNGQYIILFTDVWFSMILD